MDRFTDLTREISVAKIAGPHVEAVFLENWVFFMVSRTSSSQLLRNFFIQVLFSTICFDGHRVGCYNGEPSPNEWADRKLLAYVGCNAMSLKRRAPSILGRVHAATSLRLRYAVT